MSKNGYAPPNQTAPAVSRSSLNLATLERLAARQLNASVAAEPRSPMPSPAGGILFGFLGDFGVRVIQCRLNGFLKLRCVPAKNCSPITGIKF